MLDKVGFKIIDVELNDTNGGSFMIIAAKNESPQKTNKEIIAETMQKEKKTGVMDSAAFSKFKSNVTRHRKELLTLLKTLKQNKKTVFGYGASTKGNVILQWCSITPNEIPFIAEVNDDKFGSFTPRTLIPIISEKQARAMKPDYFLVLPWHFRENIIEKEKEFRETGGKFIFPLPEIEIV